MITEKLTQDLVNLFSEYRFSPYMGNPIYQKKWDEVWRCKISNASNCQSNIFIRLLNDNETIRLSISDEESENIEAIDVFETKDIHKVKRFMELVV